MTPLIPDDKSRLAWLDGNPIIVGQCRLDRYDGGTLVVIDAPNRLKPFTEQLAALMEIHLAPVADRPFSAGRWREVADEGSITIVSIPILTWLTDDGLVRYGLGEVEVNPRVAGEVFDEGLAGVYAGMGEGLG